MPPGGCLPRSRCDMPFECEDMCSRGSTAGWYGGGPVGAKRTSWATTQVFVTETHLGVALEYAAGGELFDTVARAGKLPEIEARYFFQQLILGLEYCHNKV